MRISEKKLNRITRQMMELLEKDTHITLLSDSATISAEIKSVILEDMQMEDMIELEAKRVLEEHSDRIALENVDYQKLLNRAKMQIAKQKKFVL